MSLVTALFARGSRRQRRAIPSIRLERLEVRRALAADDGSDPWDGYVPPEDDGGAVDIWVDPGQEITASFSTVEDDGALEAGNVIVDYEWADDELLPPQGACTQAITYYRNVKTGGRSVQFTGGWWSRSGNWVEYIPDWAYSSGGIERGGAADVSAPPPAFTSKGPGARPTDVVATPTADGIVVTWNDPFANQGEGGPAIDGYVVEARRLRDAAWTTVATVTGATTSTVSGLYAAAHYAFRVTKTNIGMTMMLSAPSRPSRPVTTAAVVGISAETTATGGARISWNGAAAGAGEQIVEFRRLAATDWVRVGAFPAASGVATIDGLPGGRHYTFRILSAGGVYTPRTRAVTLPAEVEYTLTASAGATGTVLTWSDPLAATRTETVVEYRRLKDSVWSALGSVASATGEMKVDGLVPNANYVFRLRQVDAAGLLSRTVATRPMTFGQAVSSGSPAGGSGSGTVLIVNPAAGNAGGTEIAGAGSTGSSTQSGGLLTGTLIATGHLAPVGGGPGTLVLGSAGGAG